MGGIPEWLRTPVLAAIIAAVRGRLLVRLSGPEATKSWPIGSRVGISVSPHDGIAFAAS